MKRSYFRCAGLLVASIVAGGCGSSSPNSDLVLPSPVVANLSGMWRGTSTVVGVTGGECVGAMMAESVGGVDTRTLAVVQDGTGVTANVTSAESGLGCEYTGRVALNTLVLNAASCSAGPSRGESGSVYLAVQCTDGRTRQLELVGSTITATVAGGVVTGTMAERFNVLDPNDDPVAGLVVNHTISATRR